MLRIERKDMSLRIEKYLNITPEEVQNKQHNIWIGISLGNKYWNDDRNVGEFIKWAAENTKEKVLVVIGDALHAINLEVLDYRTPEAAMRKALRIGEERCEQITDLIKFLPDEVQEKVSVARWNDVTSSDLFKKRLQIVKEEYKNNLVFKEYVRETVRIGRKDREERIEKLSERELDRLAEYILNELPHFVNGVQKGKDVYTLIPYPGLTKLDDLFVGLQNKTLFPELTEKLKIKNKIAIVEAYA